jgi:hypothetical protein
MTKLPNAQDAARQLIAARFPDCDAVFLAGSVVRGDATPNSDLDLVILTADPDAPYRESLVFAGWPVELFVHNAESVRAYFRSDAARGMPSLPMMCAEGLLLRDTDGLGAQVKAEAEALLAAGPDPLTAQAIASQRYALTDALDDLEGIAHSGNTDELFFIAAELADKAANFLLAYHRQWQGHGKWTLRALRRYDPALADRLVRAVRAAYRQEDIHELVAFVELALAPVGGRLFAGYRLGGRR